MSSCLILKLSASSSLITSYQKIVRNELILLLVSTDTAIGLAIGLVSVIISAAGVLIGYLTLLATRTGKGMSFPVLSIYLAARYYIL
jgi:hypothetical protein